MDSRQARSIIALKTAITLLKDRGTKGQEEYESFVKKNSSYFPKKIVCTSPSKEVTVPSLLELNLKKNDI
jgi:hypothetical protein